MPKPVKPADAKQLESKINELTADLQRVHADFVNFRRRSEEEQGQLMDVAKEQVIMHLLPLLDNIERALTHVPKELANNPWAVGVSKIGEQAKATLQALGVEPIQAKGQAFDPNFHEAVNFEEGTGEHEVVTDEIQTGYKIGDHVIRPAMVKVTSQHTRASHPEEQSDEGSDKKEDSNG